MVNSKHAVLSDAAGERGTEDWIRLDYLRLGSIG